MVTIDTILNWFQEQIEQKIPVSAGMYLEAAQKMIVLLANIDDEIVEKELTVNRQIADMIESGDSVSAAKIKVKALNDYADLQRLIAKKERAKGFIQISKKRVELQNFDY